MAALVEVLGEVTFDGKPRNETEAGYRHLGWMRKFNIGDKVTGTVNFERVGDGDPEDRSYFLNIRVGSGQRTLVARFIGDSVGELTGIMSDDERLRMAITTSNYRTAAEAASQDLSEAA